MNEFIQESLACLAAALNTKKKEFINYFISVSANSRFTVENAEKIWRHLTNPANHKIGSTELAPGLKVNIDWTVLKEEAEVFPEVHAKFHDVHIPTFTEGMYISAASEDLPVHVPFDETKDIGFYEKPETSFATKIEKNSWKFIPAGVYHGPLYGGYEDDPKNYFLENGKKHVVKICIKILAD